MMKLGMSQISPVKLFLAWFYLAIIASASASYASAGMWNRIGPYGGSIRDIAIRPGDPETILAATANAGIFRSSDGGQSWKTVNTGLASSEDSEMISPYRVYDLDFSSVDTEIVFARTSIGVFKSINGGISWERCPVQFDAEADSVVATDPNHSETVYVGGYGRFFKSVDGGQTWQEISNGIPHSSSIEAILFDPGNTDIIYLGGSFGDGPKARKIYKSNNAGLTWKPFDSGMPDSVSVRCLALDPRNPNTIYAGTTGGYYKTLNGGSAWSKVSSRTQSIHTIVVDPFNSNRLWSGANEGAYISNDGGSIWRPIWTGMGNIPIYSLAVDPSMIGRIYAGSGLQIPYGSDNPPGGIYRSKDGGQYWEPINNGLSASPIFSLEMDHYSGQKTLYAGGHSRVYRMDISSTRWESSEAGSDEIPAVRVFPQDPKILYALSGGVIRKSVDGGVSWEIVGFHSDPVFSLVVSPNRSDTLYIGTYRGIFKSTSSGKYWSQASGGLYQRYGDYTRIPVIEADFRFPNTVYAGVDWGGVYKTSNGGNSWGASNTGLPGGTTSAGDWVFAAVRALTIDPSNSNILYAGTGEVTWPPSGRGIYRSQNGGLTWEPINNGLPEKMMPGHYVPVFAILVDPTDSETIFAGTYGSGVYRSEDRGSSWKSLGKPDSPCKYVRDLAIDPDNPNVLYVGSEDGAVCSVFVDSPTILSYPIYRSNSNSYTGFSLSNQEERVTYVEFTAYGETGEMLPMPFNPSTTEIAPGNQFLKLGNEIFNDRLTVDRKGWVKVRSSQKILAMGMIGSDRLLDGAQPQKTPAKKLFFTRIHHGNDGLMGQDVKTFLSLVNPTQETVRVVLRLNISDPTLNSVVKRYEKEAVISPNGCIQKALSGIFPEAEVVHNGYLAADVVEGEGVIGNVWIEFMRQKTAFGLSAQHNTSFTRLFSAQLAKLDGLFMNIKLLNTSSEKREAILEVIDESGRAFFNPVEVLIDPGGCLEKEVDEIFPFKENDSFVGTLIINLDGPGVIGDVVFGDSRQFSYAAGLPLQTEFLSRTYFGQIADSMGYYTGIALYNPHPNENEIEMGIYSRDGSLTGKTIIKLQAGNRLSRLTSELIPSTKGQIGGYILLSSDQSFIAQALFGGRNFLATVPPVEQ